MNIVKKFIKNQKGKIIYRSLPECGVVNLLLTISSPISNLYSFFCASNENFEPSFHISLEKIKDEFFIVVGRYNKDKKKWIHQKSTIPLELNKEYFIEIFYGERNEIHIGNKNATKLSESINMNFKHEKNFQVSFGDLNNLIEESPITIKKFQVRSEDAKTKQNTCIFNVPEPKVLDLKSFRVLD